jgi:hypothetical protein
MYFEPRLPTEIDSNTAVGLRILGDTPHEQRNAYQMQSVANIDSMSSPYQVKIRIYFQHLMQ